MSPHSEGAFQQFVADWSRVQDLDLLPANAFLGQLGAPTSGAIVPDTIYLLAGHVAPPVIVADNPMDAEKQLRKLNGKLPVLPMARFVLTRERAVELRDLMASMVEQYDAAHKQGVAHG